MSSGQEPGGEGGGDPTARPGSPEDGARSLEEYVGKLEDALAHREEKIDELESRVRHLMADFQNYKKRAKRRVEEAERRGREDVIESMLRVRDDLERALETGGDLGAVEGGLKMTLRRFDSLLDGEGVREIDVSGFDPEKHEVVALVERSDFEDDEIVEVHRAGFESEESVLRPARVTVARKPGDERGEGEP